MHATRRCASRTPPSAASTTCMRARSAWSSAPARRYALFVCLYNTTNNNDNNNDNTYNHNHNQNDMYYIGLCVFRYA